jgi:tRNA(adenine34) deaminase
MKDFHLFFMQKALEEAREALLEREVPVGAVLVSGDGTIISRAHNRSIALHDPTAHAEILALRQGAAALENYRIVGSTLFVTVEPCVMCAGALIWARIKMLVYGAPDLKVGAVDSLYRIPRDPRQNHRPEIVSGVMERECREIMQGFFEERRSRVSPA